MKIAAHIVIGLMTLGMALQALQWLGDPNAAAAGLGMPLLDGVGASTQIGDLSAFFAVAAIMMGLGQRRGQSHWLYPPALMFGGAAVMRSLAAGLGYADFAPQFIVPEVVMAALLVGAARILAAEPDAEAA